MTTKYDAAHKKAGLVYCLWLLGILFGITALIGAFISHVNLHKFRDTHAYSHFIWQIASFWLLLAGVATTIYLWPSESALMIGFACFFIWLFSGLIGSWYLSKGKRLRFIDPEHRPERNHQPHHNLNTESSESLYEQR